MLIVITYGLTMSITEHEIGMQGFAINYRFASKMKSFFVKFLFKKYMYKLDKDDENAIKRIKLGNVDEIEKDKAKSGFKNIFKKKAGVQMDVKVGDHAIGKFIGQQIEQTKEDDKKKKRKLKWLGKIMEKDSDEFQSNSEEEEEKEED